MSATCNVNNLDLINIHNWKCLPSLRRRKREFSLNVKYDDRKIL